MVGRVCARARGADDATVAAGSGQPASFESGVTADARPRGGARVQLALAVRRAQVHSCARGAYGSKGRMGRKSVFAQPIGRFRARKVLQWGKEDAGTHRSHSRGTAWFFGWAIELGHGDVGLSPGERPGFFLIVTGCNNDGRFADGYG